MRKRARKGRELGVAGTAVLMIIKGRHTFCFCFSGFASTLIIVRTATCTTTALGKIFGRERYLEVASK